MYCPNCDSEQKSQITHCPRCGLPLVDRPPGPGPLDSRPPDIEVVFADGRGELIAIAKSILLDSGIRFLVRGEGVQDLFAYGRFPLGFNAFVGPVEILVSNADAPVARELLVGLTAPALPAEPGAGPSAEISSAAPLWRHAKPVAKAMAKVVTGIALAALVVEAALAWLGPLLGR